MRVRGADLSVDGFAVPVNRAVRSILRQIPPEDTTFARLDVSALGATFHALASGGGFRWEQHAVLGRDERVTTQWRGVLLPFGHKVLYTEDTLRGTSEFEGEGHHEWIAALRMTGTLTILEPVGYLESLSLIGSAALVITDSGGIQREAYWLGVPCITLRAETEWIETVELGANTLVPPSSVQSDLPRAVAEQAVRWQDGAKWKRSEYGEGQAALKVVTAIQAWLPAAQ